MRARSPVLGYARPRRRLWRSPVLKAAATLIACGLVLHFTGWGRLAVARCRLLLVQRRCLAYAVPPETVVADWRGIAHTPLPVMPFPEAFLEYEREAMPGLQLARATAYPQYGWQITPPPQKALVWNLFLHERAAAGGPRRLVAVQFVYRPEELITLVITPATLRCPPTFRVGPADLDFHSQQLLHDTQAYREGIVYFGGQPDPSDASHFEISYADHWGRHAIDGWLRADDTVQMKVRFVRSEWVHGE